MFIRRIILFVLCLHSQIYGWPEISIAKETQEFLAKQIVAITTNLPKNCGREMGGSIDTICSNINDLSHAFTNNLKSIPIMGLGFITALYALQSLKNNAQELSQAIEDHDQDKQKKHVRWSTINMVVLMSSFLVITKSNRLVALLA